MAAETSRLRSINDLPGPSRLPLVGNLHQIIPTSRMHLTFEQWAKRHGPIVRFDVGGRRAILISDVDEINTILRDRPGGFRRWSEQQQISQEMMSSRSLVYAEGDDWKRQRRLVVTALNTNHLHHYFHVITTSTERLHRRLADAAREGRILDIQHELTSYTVDITSALAFGQDLNTLERGENELQGHIELLLRMTARRLATPVKYWRWFKLPADRALERSVAEIRRAITEFIEQARMRLSERPELREAPENFLEGMLAAQETDGSYTDNEIVGNTLAILTAGEDTTALTLGWAIWFLASQPEIQTRLAQEAGEVLGEQPFLCEHEAVARLRYSEAVLREAMRLKSVVPLLTVEPLMDTTICGTHIPAGTHLMLLTRYAGLQAGISEEESFDPERWLPDSAGERRAPDQKSFLGFGAGPRFCPGHNLAFLEAKTALAMVVRNFEIELDDSEGPVQEQYTFTLAPQGLRVRLLERTATQPMALAVTG
jgi:cytochrome P450